MSLNLHDLGSLYDGVGLLNLLLRGTLIVEGARVLVSISMLRAEHVCALALEAQ